ncbi:MAG: hypothetical protein JXA73_08710 [Acidobacteria bacterium]|nr:hypothetical protein [Acidobacteriota bacterium]
MKSNLIDFDLLGKEAEDKVTGFTGIVTSISYDLYGCVQAVLTPKYKENEKAELQRGTWFDTKRLKVLDENPVIEIPDFNRPPGGYEKPDFAQLP